MGEDPDLCNTQYAVGHTISHSDILAGQPAIVDARPVHTGQAGGQARRTVRCTISVAHMNGVRVLDC